MTQEHETVAKCHAAIFDYAEHVMPFKNRCSGKWTESVVSDHEFPDGDSLAVALSEIEHWADRRYKQRVGKTDELTGQKQDTQIKRVHIPYGYARKVYWQLNECLEKLGLAADLDNKTFDTKNDDPGLIHGDG
jgi:hypothetical protein